MSCDPGGGKHQLQTTPTHAFRRHTWPGPRTNTAPAPCQGCQALSEAVGAWTPCERCQAASWGIESIDQALGAAFDPEPDGPLAEIDEDHSSKATLGARASDSTLQDQLRPHPAPCLDLLPPDPSIVYLTESQAARYLNVAPRYVRRLVQERRLRSHKLGKFVRFRREDLDDLAVARGVDPRPAEKPTRAPTRRRGAAPSASDSAVTPDEEDDPVVQAVRRHRAEQGRRPSNRRT